MANSGVSLQSGRVVQHHSTFVQKPLMWLKGCTKNEKAFDLSPQWIKYCSNQKIYLHILYRVSYNIFLAEGGGGLVPTT